MINYKKVSYSSCCRFIVNSGNLAEVIFIRPSLIHAPASDAHAGKHHDKGKHEG